MSQKFRLNLIAPLLLLLVISLGYQFAPMLLPQTNLTVDPDPQCQLQESSCAVSLAKGEVLELTMGTRPVPMAKPFEISVRTSGFEAKRLEVDFSGVEMNMGVNRYELSLRAPGEYTAVANLPVCVSGEMAWLVTVNVERGLERIAIPFRLTTSGH